MSQDSPISGLQLSERDELLRRIQELEERCRRAEDALRISEDRNRLLGDSAPFGIFVVENEGRVFGANQKMLNMLDWPSDRDVTELNVLQYPPLVDSGVADSFRRCLEKRTRIVSEHPCLRIADGCEHLRFHICPVLEPDGRLSGIIAFVEDVTELKLAEETIKASEKKYRLLFESAPVAMIERDAGELKRHLEQLRAEGISDLISYFNQNPQEVARCMGLIKTVNCNTAFLDLMETQTMEEIDSGIRLSNSPEDFMRMAREIILMMADGNFSLEREDTFLTLKGNEKSVLGKSLSLGGHEDTFSRILIAMVDITKRKQAEEALRVSEQRFREQALRDNLTGLYNRRYLYQSLTALIEHAKANGSVVSVIFMDLDRFKSVVDTYGHLNGSRTIKEVATTIQENLEKPAYAVAYAGDEFVVVLPDFDQPQALEQAKKIQDRIRNHVFLRDQGFDVSIRSSFGVATFPYHADDMTNLLASADQALFGAKGAGKDTVKFAKNSGSQNAHTTKNNKRLER
jgi:diguanylate cyclase (GGDEF)-like protein/PAS domain S-box-containing protein